MSVQKFLSQVAGQIREVIATVTSAGAANAGQIPALNSSGLLDITLMPTGVGPDTIVVPSSEALLAGAFVNIWSNAGTTNARNANATDTTKPAQGYVLSAVASAGNATVFLSGENNVLTGLTVGSQYFLGATAGLATTTAPSATGNNLQSVGYAISATTIQFQPAVPIQLA
jgi:hypothetical protein